MVDLMAELSGTEKNENTEYHNSSRVNRHQRRQPNCASVRFGSLGRLLQQITDKYPDWQPWFTDHAAWIEIAPDSSRETTLALLKAVNLCRNLLGNKDHPTKRSKPLTNPGEEVVYPVYDPVQTAEVTAAA